MLMIAPFLVASSISLLVPGTAQQPSSKPNYDYIFQVESKPLKDFLTFPNSSFKDFVKLDVTITDVKAKSTKDFEELIVCSQKNGQTGLIACNRHADMQIDSEKYVSIQMKFSEKSTGEQEAMSAAYAVPTLLLELHQLYKDKGVYAGDVYVPAASFDTFRQSLSNQGFQPMDQGTSNGSSGFPIHLIQDPGGDYKVLIYQQTLKKKA